MYTWKSTVIIRCSDGSYRINYMGYPDYHVPNTDRWATLWAEIDAYAREHPEQVTDEPAPPQPTERELLEIARNNKLVDFDTAMSNIDNALIRSTTDLMSVMLTPSVIEADIDIDTATKSKDVFVKLRDIQSQNRVFRSTVVNATTIDEINSINPILYKDINF